MCRTEHVSRALGEDDCDPSALRLHLLFPCPPPPTPGYAPPLAGRRAVVGLQPAHSASCPQAAGELTSLLLAACVADLAPATSQCSAAPCAGKPGRECSASGCAQPRVAVQPSAPARPPTFLKPAGRYGYCADEDHSDGEEKFPGFASTGRSIPPMRRALSLDGCAGELRGGSAAARWLTAVAEAEASAPTGGGSGVGKLAVWRAQRAEAARGAVEEAAAASRAAARAAAERNANSAAVAAARTAAALERRRALLTAMSEPAAARGARLARVAARLAGPHNAAAGAAAAVRAVSPTATVRARSELVAAEASERRLAGYLGRTGVHGHRLPAAGV